MRPSQPRLTSATTSTRPSLSAGTASSSWSASPGGWIRT